MARINKRVKMTTAGTDAPPTGPFPFERGTMNEQHVDLDKGGIHVLIKEAGVVNRTACQHCIGGHRVKGCKHWFRVLRNAKRAGRPLTHCDHTVDCGEVCTEDAAFVCIDPPEYYELSGGLPVRIAHYMGQVPKHQKGAEKVAKSGTVKHGKERSSISVKGSSRSTSASISPKVRMSPNRQRSSMNVDLCLPVPATSGSTSCVSSGCQCGPSCRCVGCKIHGNTIPSDEPGNPCACQTCQCYSEVVIHATAGPEHDQRPRAPAAAPVPTPVRGPALAPAAGGCCSSKSSAAPKVSQDRASHHSHDQHTYQIASSSGMHGIGMPGEAPQFHYPAHETTQPHNFEDNDLLVLGFPHYDNLDPDTLTSQASSMPFVFNPEYEPGSSATMTPFIGNDTMEPQSAYSYASPYDIIEPDMSIFDSQFGQYNDEMLANEISFSHYHEPPGCCQPADEPSRSERTQQHQHIKQEVDEQQQPQRQEPPPPRRSCCGGGEGAHS